MPPSVDMIKKRLLLTGILFALSLTACDIEMPALVYSEMPGTRTGVSRTSASSDPVKVNTSLRLPANKISKTESARMARQYGERFGVETSLVLGVITQESGFNANAVSHAGAMGMMQIMPGTVQHINDMGQVKINDAFNAEENVRAGTWYLKSLYDQLSSLPEARRWEFALASYNGGIGTVTRAMEKITYATGKGRSSITWQDLKPYLPSETQNYVPAVLSHTAYYRQNI